MRAFPINNLLSKVAGLVLCLVISSCIYRCYEAKLMVLRPKER
jgi:hypothetical protein